MAVASLFIAADRLTAHAASMLAGDAVALGYQVRWDRELPNGEAWWSRSLDAIERSDALVYALSDSSITSTVSQEQLRYAIDLGMPVLPVLLVGDVADVDLPPSLGQIQRIDYRNPSAGAMAQLFSAIQGLTLEPRPPVQPLRPECPAEFGVDLVSRLTNPAVLNRQEQEAVLNQLARYVDLGFAAAELDPLLRLLHERRPDLTVLASNRLDTIETTLGASAATPAPPPPPPPPSVVVPDGDPPVRTLFVSYSRSEREIVDHLVEDLRRLGFTVWIDQNLPGGKPWWDQVLLNIRQADAFIFAAGPDSLQSRACRAEFDYARALGAPIVRLDVKAVEPSPGDTRWTGLAVSSYTAGDKVSMARLAQALRHLSKSVPPAVPPPPPDVPATYLFDVQNQLRSHDELDLAAQQELLGQIRRYAQEGVAAGDLRRLLDTFERRQDTTIRTSEAIAALRVDLNIPSGPIIEEDRPDAAAVPPDQSPAEDGEARLHAETEARLQADAERARLLEQAETERQREAEAAARAGRSRRRLIGAGVALTLLVGGGVAGALLLGGDDEQSTIDSTDPVIDTVPSTEEPDDSVFTLPTPVVVTVAPEPTEPPQPTVPDPTVAPFQGVNGSAQVSWQVAGVPYSGVVTTQGGSGVADVQFVDPALGTLIVRQDLSLVEQDGEWYYVGSSPRFADGTPAATYSPDRFHLAPAAAGSWVFDEVCDQTACYAVTTTPL